ncbi:MAG: hypothetical protein R3D51_00135 [Hyphomicrobiaceae bacterium]
MQIGAYTQIHQIIGGIADRALSAAVKIGLHAVVGGAVSVAQGGSFETGALTGAVAAGSSLLMDSSGLMGHSGDGVPENVAARTAVSAVAGGTASVLSGGKFANGAITGAFAQLYNADAAALAKAATRGFAVRFTATAATAATIAAMDGPLPVGDIIGGGLLIYDAVTTVYGYIFNSDGYTDLSGNKPPIVGEPGSTVRTGTGSRTYGEDGYPLIDRDWPHQDEAGVGCGDHCHDWGRPEGGAARHI